MTQLGLQMSLSARQVHVSLGGFCLAPWGRSSSSGGERRQRPTGARGDRSRALKVWMSKDTVGLLLTGGSAERACHFRGAKAPRDIPNRASRAFSSEMMLLGPSGKLCLAAREATSSCMGDQVESMSVRNSAGLRQQTAHYFKTGGAAPKLDSALTAWRRVVRAGTTRLQVGVAYDSSSGSEGVLGSALPSRMEQQPRGRKASIVQKS